MLVKLFLPERNAPLLSFSDLSAGLPDGKNIFELILMNDSMTADVFSLILWDSAELPARPQETEMRCFHLGEHRAEIDLPVGIYRLEVSAKNNMRPLGDRFDGLSQLAQPLTVYQKKRSEHGDAFEEEFRW